MGYVCAKLADNPIQSAELKPALVSAAEELGWAAEVIDLTGEHYGWDHTGKVQKYKRATVRLKKPLKNFNLQIMEVDFNIVGPNYSIDLFYGLSWRCFSTRGMAKKYSDAVYRRLPSSRTYSERGPISKISFLMFW